MTSTAMNDVLALRAGEVLEAVVGARAPLDLVALLGVALRGLLDLEEVVALLVHRDHRVPQAVGVERDAPVGAERPPRTARRALDVAAAQHDDVEVTEGAEPGLAAVLRVLEAPSGLVGDGAPQISGARERRLV